MRDSGDPTDTVHPNGYGYGDYGPTVYTDIDPNGLTTSATLFPATPYRNKASRANGMLKQGATRLAEVTDGLSSTIAFGEDAGRTEYFLSPYTEISANGGDPRGMGPYGPNQEKRYWRWAEPDAGFGVSGMPNNSFRPMQEQSAWQNAPGPLLTAGNNGGANDELFSYHSGGINLLFGDGSVKFVKSSVNVVVLRKLVTLNGGEVVSASDY